MSDKILKQLVLGDDLADEFGDFNLGNLGFCLADFEVDQKDSKESQNEERSSEKIEESPKNQNKKNRLGKKKLHFIKPPDDNENPKPNHISHKEDFSNTKKISKILKISENSNKEIFKNNKIPQEKDLDLKLICIHDGEKIYKLSDLFIPKDQKIIKKIERYNNKIMSISEKEKYEKENDGQKKEISESDEIKQIIKKAKRNQKFTKINITYDEKFFDRTHFLENIHASTLASQEMFLLENKEQIKKKILQEGLLKSFGILEEKKIDDILIERNLLNSLFYIKVKLSQSERINVESESEEIPSFIDGDLDDVMHRKEFNEENNFINNIKDGEDIKMHKASDLDEKNIKENNNILIEKNSYGNNVNKGNETGNKSALSCDNIKSNLSSNKNEYTEIINLDGNAIGNKNDNGNFMKNKISGQENFNNEKNFPQKNISYNINNNYNNIPQEYSDLNKISSITNKKNSENLSFEEKQYFSTNPIKSSTKSIHFPSLENNIKKLALNDQANKNENFPQLQKTNFEESEILKLNSIIIQNVSKNLNFNPEDLQDDKFLLENPNETQHFPIIPEEDYEENLNNPTENYNTNNLMDLDNTNPDAFGNLINTNHNLLNEFDNFNNFSFNNNLKINLFNSQPEKILENKINPEKNIKNSDNLPNTTNLQNFSNTSQNLKNKNQSNKKSSEKNKLLNPEEIEDYENYDDDQQNENSENSENSSEQPIEGIFETQEFKLFNLSESNLLKNLEESTRKKSADFETENNLNNIFSLPPNNISDSQKFDFQFNKPLPNFTKEKNFLANNNSYKDLSYTQEDNLSQGRKILKNLHMNLNDNENSNFTSELPGLDEKKKILEKKKEENFIGIKKERDGIDIYDLYNKSKCRKHKQQGFYNESLLTGDYIPGILLTDSDIYSNRHKYFEIAKKIYDINDYNMNFEILKSENLTNSNKKDKEKDKENLNNNSNNTPNGNYNLNLDLGGGTENNYNSSLIKHDAAYTKTQVQLSNVPTENLLQETYQNIPVLPLNEDKLNYSANINNINNCTPEDFFNNLSAKLNNNTGNNQGQNFLKIGKAKGNLLTHAKCSYNLTYNKINLTYDDLRDFHRPNFCKFLLREKKKRNFSFTINDNYNISNGDKMKRWDVSIITRNFLKKQEKKRISKNIQYMNAYEIFKDRHKLSLNDGKYALFEHLDENPLFISNFGMASKLKKFVYTPKLFQVNVANPNTKLSDVELKTYNLTGQYGSQILLQQNQKLPLVGQIDQNELKGLLVVDNKMYRAPSFYEKVKNPISIELKNENNLVSKENIENKNNFSGNKKKNIINFNLNNTENNNINLNNFEIVEKDGKKYYNFLLTFKKSKEGKESFILREMEHNYVVAQEEPKIEVYPPQSRQYNNFLKKKIQTYTYKLYDEIGYKRGINFKEFTNLFPNVTEQILKKNFREMNIEIDKNICFFSKIPSEDNHMLITPENICQFESCQFGIYKLREVGIKNLTNPDKISYATNKYINQTPDQKQQFLAKVIEEELLTTPWNITQNFLQAKQIKGMLAIKGIGDPSNGQGGYSFLKMPVKTYNDNKTLKEEIDILKNANKNIKTVTGTDADLRKLSKEDIKMKLIQLGQDEEIINKLSRWERVSLLRYRSSQAAQMGYEGDITKYARGTRMNSKLQRDTYQKNINDVFKKQIQYITGENQENYISESEDSETEYLFENTNNKVIDLDEEDPKKGLNFMKNEIYSNPNNKKKKRPESKRIGISSEQGMKKQNEDKIIKLYKKNPGEIQVGDGNTRIKLDIKNIDLEFLQRKKKSSQHFCDIYEYEMDKTSNLLSRKRRDTPERSFNELIEDIIDNCIKFDNSKVFHQPVKKKDYKDYYDIIKNPTDLGTMKNKTKRNEYKFLSQFLEDLDLMVNNSKAYNGEEHDVTLQAGRIKEHACKKIEEYKDKIDEMENKLHPKDD